jgi:hypothetical protein
VGAGMAAEGAAGIANHEPAGEIAKAEVLTAVVTLVARAVDGGMDYDPSEAEEGAAEGTPFEDKEKFTFGGAQLGTMRAATALPEDLYSSDEIYRVFNDDGQPDSAFPVVQEYTN